MSIRTRSNDLRHSETMLWSNIAISALSSSLDAVMKRFFALASSNVVIISRFVSYRILRKGFHSESSVS